MKTSTLLVGLFALGMGLLVPGYAHAAGTTDHSPTAAVPAPVKDKSVYDYKMKSLDGPEIDLAKYKGKVLLILNTASKCGYTPQYKALEAVHEKYKDKGLVVLGFPANEFGHQEPGTDAEIGEFCQKNYGVTFQMFSKVVVKGEGQTPLFHYLTQEANPTMTGDISWNFEKFLIARDGKMVGRYKSAITPDSAELTSAIETELAKK